MKEGYVQADQAKQKQRQKALRALACAGQKGLTAGEAAWGYGVVNLATKISDLKAAGIRITKHREKDRGWVHVLERGGE